jgi:YHS domain-containing protein
MMFSLILVAAFAFPAAADEHKGNQTKCPVMGNPINEQVYTDYKDNRVFFCCEGCIEPFHKDPEKYLKQMADEGVTPMKLKKQSVCPVSGETLMNHETFIDVENKRVYLCCAGCKSKVKADPAKYMKVIADRGEYLEDVEKTEE